MYTSLTSRTTYTGYGLIILLIFMFFCKQSVLGAVNVQAVSSCSSASKPTLKVQQKELSEPKLGLYVLSLNTTNGEYNYSSFHQPMKPFIFDISGRRTKNRLEFVNYFNSLKNNTVVVFVTKGLCRYRSFGDWIFYLKVGTDLVFERKDYKGDWMSAVVVACKSSCPEDVEPVLIHGQNDSLNVTFRTKEPTESKKNETTKIIIISCVVAAIIFIFLIAAFLVHRYYHNNRRNNKHENQNGVSSSEEAGQAYEDNGEYERVEDGFSNNVDVPSSTSQQYVDLKRSHSQYSTGSNTYQDLLAAGSEGGDYKSLKILKFHTQNSNTSNNYQDLLSPPDGGDQTPTDVIYSSIETPTKDFSNVPSGTSFNLFKHSIEDLNQDSTYINKDNFASYIAVDDQQNNNSTKTNIYKKPSSVPKFRPPAENVVRPDAFGNAAGNHGVSEPVYESV